MKLRIVAIFLSMIFFCSPIFISNAMNNLQTLDEMSDQALQLVKSNRYEEAKRLLHTFDQTFSQIVAEKILINMDEIRMVNVLLHDTIRSLEQSSSHEEMEKNATKLRLVVDAISSNYQPLWSEMEGTVIDAFQSFVHAVDMGDKDQLTSQLNSFLYVYDLIYPSLLLDVSPEMINKIDARVQYIKQHQDYLANKQGKEELQALQEELQSVFDQVSESDETDPSLWWVIISTGGIIISTLSYVGWRKYKADQEKAKTKKGFYN